MKTIIYGAGGIGSVIGGLLARAGREVVLIGRPGHVNAIDQHGLTLVTPGGTYNVRVPAETGPEQVDIKHGDVVLLTMKGQNTEAALHDLKVVSLDVPIFCVQNGVRNEEITSQYFPRVYGVMVRIGTEYLKDGEVVCYRDPPGWLVMGHYPTGKDALVEEVAGNIRAAGFQVMTTADVMPYKWGKLMANLANAIGAITNSGGGTEYSIVARGAREELSGLLKAAGIRWLSQEEVAKEWPEVNQPLHGQLRSPAQNSTWQSLMRQQGSVESEFLNGEVVRLARKLGKQAPVNGRLLQITTEMARNREKPGKYTPAQLVKLLALEGR